MPRPGDCLLKPRPCAYCETTFRPRNAKSRFCSSRCAHRKCKDPLSRWPEYAVWHQMLERCYREKNPAYRLYGAQGVRVCDRWRASFRSFIEDMGRRPGPEFTIERLDGKRNYEPDNCKWATRVEQNRNTSRNTLIELDGRKELLVDWSHETGLSESTIARRLQRGWSVRDSLTRPSQRSARNLVHG